MKAILSVLARNINKQELTDGKTVKSSQPIEALIVFIRQHIYQPECLRIEYLAEKFHYSAHYLNTFFKKQTGEPLQQYILKYKLKLIENCLQYSHLSIAEIAHEFGFSDESHLNKIFRKYYGLPPGAYRNKVLK